ncbi:nuclear transport factor 2 family protein [Streptomyces sp. NPDC048172]|uniref:nuclear transport factor 2 family protein n=1 Tax=Streptomyces sp. NPDC048172 TaxID=3365505 RepID=UPI00371460F9
MHDPDAFRRAAEARDTGALRAALAPGVVFNSPVMTGPYEGREAVAERLRAVGEVFEDLRYTDELDSWSAAARLRSRALLFEARASDKALQGMDVLRFDRSGLVAELTVLVRPLPAAMTLARLVGARLTTDGVTP